MTLYNDPLDYELNYLSTKDCANNTQFLEDSIDNDSIILGKNDFLTQINNNNIIIEDNNLDIYEIPHFNPIQQNTKTLLGRKKKNSGEMGKHNKYSENNMIRKIKVIIKNAILNFINSKIQNELKLSNIIIKNKKIEKERIKLLNIKQDQIVDTSVENNIKFLHTTIKDILSYEISGNYNNFPKEFNKLLIEQLYKFENSEKVTCIFDITFLECLKYFRMDEDIINDSKYKCLNGFEKNYEEIKDKLLKDNDEKYVNGLVNLMKNYEKIYYNKKSRLKRMKII